MNQTTECRGNRVRMECAFGYLTLAAGQAESVGNEGDVVGHVRTGVAKPFCGGANVEVSDVPSGAMLSQTGAATTIVQPTVTLRRRVRLAAFATSA